MLCKTGTFTIPNSGTVTTTITGVGFQPKLVVFYGFDGLLYGPCKFATGFDDATTHLGVCENSGDFGAAFSQSEQMWSDQYSLLRCANLASELHTQRMAGYISSMDVDGFTITWAFIGDNDHVIYGYKAIGGSDVNAKVVQVQSNGTSSQTVTVGFRARGLLSFAAPGVTGGTFSSVGGLITFGAATPCNDQAYTLYGTDAAGVNPSVTNSEQIAKAFIGPNVQGTISAWNATSFNISWNPTSNVDWFGCAILGGNIAFNIGLLEQPAVTGLQSVTVPAFTPKGLILFSDMKVASGSVTPNMLFQIGATDGTNQNSFWTGNLNGKPAPTWTYANDSGTKVAIIGLPTGNGAGSNLAEATFSSFAPTGFTINWGMTDAVARSIVYVLLADNVGDNVCGIQGGQPGAGIYKMVVGRTNDRLFV